VRAARAGLRNLLYVRAAVEALPQELTGVADHITVILPWGSLLAAVARPIVPILGSVRAQCQSGARLTVVLGLDPERDRAEARRLGLADLNAAHFEGDLAAGYAAAGFTVRSVRALAAEELARWPSSWAKRLAFGQPRPVFQIEARCAP
jgi:16S rRNA (adenine(1408)-N(1))-methyltransferase